MKDRSISVIEAIASIDKGAGGTSAFMSDLSYHLPAADSNFRLLTGRVPGSEDMPVDPRVEVVRLEPKKHPVIGQMSSPGAAAALDALNAQRPVDMLHFHGLWLRVGHDCAKWAQRNSVPFVLSPHGMLEPWALNHRKWKKRLAMMLYQRRDIDSAQALHACSHQEAEGIRRLGFKQPIAVIPNGVELPQLPAAAECEGGKVGKVGKGENTTKTALFLSRIHPKKGLLMLLDVWAELAPKGWRLCIAGNDDGVHLQEVAQKVKELGLVDVVDLPGPLFGDAKEAAFRSADLFVLPSYSENFGIVVTEALAYELPVLTTTGCPWRELQSRDCGWWVDPNHAGLKEALQTALAAEPEELTAMGKRGRQLVLDKYQWPSISERFRIFYLWLKNGGERPEFVLD